MNRLLLVCLSVIVWCVVSCSDKDKVPAGILPKDKMEKVLWDMIQAERYRESFIRDSSTMKTETFRLYAQVFEIHQVSKDEFIKSYKFYMSRPDLARIMFDSLATRANRRREELYKPKAPDTASVQQKVDSLKKSDSLKVDTAKAANGKPVIQPATPQPDKQPPGIGQPGGLPQPLTPQAPPNLRKRPNKFPLNKHLKIDSATRLQLKRQ
ncbi:DUF4296 domain-containing protein [Niastella populi]|uniref:DUF4296 domain-containing protein n=1 Tax=Niastella populi TaxID=550983 RepID=A0A1V9FGS4_9BACT|nr:DUF4296 domain-containing protein [Niastella populi]OQP57487.1 hypothetical protein A4R26_24250 [Niastella populi]